ncbi:MAG: GNAT family N-acetyltransferase [Phormidesmis sp.]
MDIRNGRLEDASTVAALLEQPGYSETARCTKDKLRQLISHPDALFLVAVDNTDKVLGFVSAHFILQLGLAGDFCRISYFCVDQQSRSSGIGRLLEASVVTAAQKRGCDHIEVHCHIRRDRAHSFYARQGYIEDPKYLLKKLPTATHLAPE